MFFIDQSDAWRELLTHAEKNKNLKIKEQFFLDAARAKKFSLDAAGIFLDYSKNLITAETLALLCSLAKKAELEKHRDAMFSGAEINVTEKRAVLHTALRGGVSAPCCK